MNEATPISDLLGQLADFAAHVERALTVPGVAWRRRPAAGEWSLAEIMCHLRDVEREIHQERFRALLAYDDAFIPGATPDDWAESRRYQQQSGPGALADFLAARQQTLALLSTFDKALWQRHGQHAFLGNVTMHELLFLVANHDQAHWEQVQGILA